MPPIRTILTLNEVPFLRSSIMQSESTFPLDASRLLLSASTRFFHSEGSKGVALIEGLSREDVQYLHPPEKKIAQTE